MSDTYLARLCGFVDDQYGIKVEGIEPATRGFYGETWKLDAGERSYFVKLCYSSPQKGVYERSFPVVEHLYQHGIDFISHIVKTKDGALSTQFDGAVVGVFDWIDGELTETDQTKGPEYDMLARIYTVPVDGVTIRREDFSGDSAAEFLQMWQACDDPDVCALFESRRQKLIERARRLSHFAALCQGDQTGFVITHGDAGGNLIVGPDKCYIVDWDDPLLAPPERDAWNMVCYKGWSTALFEAALRRHGIDYRLRTERVAYYCYYYCFFYLVELLQGLERPGVKDRLRVFFDDWAENRATYADEHF